MRKILIVAALLAGTGLLAARASEDPTNLVQGNSTQPSTRTDDIRRDDIRRDGEHVSATRDDRSYGSRAYREEHKEAREEEEDDDRD
jgi:hypothetical protein